LIDFCFDLRVDMAQLNYHVTEKFLQKTHIPALLIALYR